MAPFIAGSLWCAPPDITRWPIGRWAFAYSTTWPWRLHTPKPGLSRILVVDWDAHHGNGTQEISSGGTPACSFFRCISFPFIPALGDADEVGAGDGAGYTVNVPLSAHGSDGVYRAAFERVVLPVAEQFNPELILVSAGYDASAGALTCANGTHTRGLRMDVAIALLVVGMPRRRAHGPHLEGGYHFPALEEGLRLSIDGMLLGVAGDIPRTMDARDVARAAVMARESWQGID